MGDKNFDAFEDGLGKNAGDKDFKHAFSLHGSKAAYRRAITELLFFCSVGGEDVASNERSSQQDEML